MKHYRILEKKDINKEYTIQYLQKLFFGLFYWKNANNSKYYKYEEAFNEVKKIIAQVDYDNIQYGYHYIDAYKIFKYNAPGSKEKDTLKDVSINNITSALTPAPTKVNKSTFVQSDPNRKKVNKSVFVPKQK